MSRARALAAARHVLLGALLGVAIAWMPPALPPAIAVLLTLVLPVLVWLAVHTPRDQRSIVLPIFLGAVAVRAGLAIAIHLALPGDAFSLDQGVYQRDGLLLAEAWAGRGVGPEHLTDKRGYYVWNALLYTLVGYVPLAPALANAAVAGVSAVLSYQLAREVAGPAAGRLAGLLAAFFPSLVLWSSLNLKDAFAILTILLSLRGAQLLQRGVSPTGVALLAIGVLGLSQLRNYLVLLVLASVAVSLVLPRLRSVPATLAVWVVLAVGVSLFPGSVEGLAEQASFETLDEHRRNLALGESAYFGNADVSTPADAIRFLPRGLAYFLLAPAPWQIVSARELLTLPEMLLWYALLPQVFFGVRHVLRHRTASALPIATFALVATLAYSLVESNLGTAYRHRAQVLVLYLVFAAVGLSTRRAARAARAEANLQPAVAM